MSHSPSSPLPLRVLCAASGLAAGAALGLGSRLVAQEPQPPPPVEPAPAAAPPAPPPPRTSADPRALLGLGWRWDLPPTELRSGWAPEGQTAPKVWSQHGQSAFAPSGLVQIVRTANGDAIVTHVRNKDLELRGSAAPQFQAVLLRADGGEPLLPRMAMGMTRRELGEMRYVFGEVAEDAVRRFALGILDLEGKRVRAAAGEERARALGARVLPLPLLGEPLAFELPTTDGGTFRSAEHRGEVILLDAWATW